MNNSPKPSLSEDQLKRLAFLSLSDEEKMKHCVFCGDKFGPNEAGHINCGGKLLDVKLPSLSEGGIGRSRGVRIPEGTHRSADFWQGFAMALASANRSFHLPTLVKSVMEGYGVTVKLLKASGVEDYDLKEIRKCMK